MKTNKKTQVATSQSKLSATRSSQHAETSASKMTEQGAPSISSSTQKSIQGTKKVHNFKVNKDIYKQVNPKIPPSMAQFATEKFKSQVKEIPKTYQVHKKQKSAVVSRYGTKSNGPQETARSIAQKSVVSKNDYIKVLDSHRSKQKKQQKSTDFNKIKKAPLGNMSLHKQFEEMTLNKDSTLKFVNVQTEQSQYENTMKFETQRYMGSDKQLKDIIMKNQGEQSDAANETIETVRAQPLDHIETHRQKLAKTKSQTEVKKNMQGQNVPNFTVKKFQKPQIIKQSVPKTAASLRASLFKQKPLTLQKINSFSDFQIGMKNQVSSKVSSVDKNVPIQPEFKKPTSTRYLEIDMKHHESRDTCSQERPESPKVLQLQPAESPTKQKYENSAKSVKGLENQILQPKIIDGSKNVFEGCIKIALGKNRNRNAKLSKSHSNLNPKDDVQNPIEEQMMQEIKLFKVMSPQAHLPSDTINFTEQVDHVQNYIFTQQNENVKMKIKSKSQNCDKSNKTEPSTSNQPKTPQSSKYFKKISNKYTFDNRSKNLSQKNLNQSVQSIKPINQLSLQAKYDEQQLKMEEMQKIIDDQKKQIESLQNQLDQHNRQEDILGRFEQMFENIQTNLKNNRDKNLMNNFLQGSHLVSQDSSQICPSNMSIKSIDEMSVVNKSAFFRQISSRNSKNTPKNEPIEENSLESICSYSALSNGLQNSRRQSKSLKYMQQMSNYSGAHKNFGSNNPTKKNSNIVSTQDIEVLMSSSQKLNPSKFYQTPEIIDFINNEAVKYNQLQTESSLPNQWTEVEDSPRP